MSAHAARPPRACSRWRPAALVTTDVVAIKLWLGVAALVRAACRDATGAYRIGRCWIG